MKVPIRGLRLFCISIRKRANKATGNLCTHGHLVMTTGNPKPDRGRIPPGSSLTTSRLTGPSEDAPRTSYAPRPPRSTVSGGAVTGTTSTTSVASTTEAPRAIAVSEEISTPTIDCENHRQGSDQRLHETHSQRPNQRTREPRAFSHGGRQSGSPRGAASTKTEATGIEA